MQTQLDLYADDVQEYIRKAREYAIEWCKDGGEISADEIRERFPIPAEWSRKQHNALGSLFKTKDFITKGIKKSTTPSRAGSTIYTWTLSNHYFQTHQKVSQ
jgi:hypothetical protein